MRFSCLSCGESAIGWFQRALVSPRFPAVCRACGQRHGVSDRQAMLSFLPVIVGIIASLLITSPWLATLSCLGGIAGYGYWFLVKVPLVRQ